MILSLINRLPGPQRARFHEAYYNFRRPIALWERDHLSVGLLQAWLLVIGYKLPMSVKVTPSGDLVCDGIFGHETLNAVIELQKRGSYWTSAPHTKPDGMIGPDTLDAIDSWLGASTTPVPTTPRSTITVRNSVGAYRFGPGFLQRYI